MDLQLDDRVAVVTGASKGIGAAVAAALAAEGARVCLVARGERRLRQTAGEIERRFGGEVLAMPGDIADPSVPERVIAAAVERWGTVHVLVNNTGGPPMGSFQEHDDDAWKQALDGLLMGCVRFTRAAAVHMVRQRWGRIVNISSTLAREPTGPMVLSGSSRAAVSAFAKSIAPELAPAGVTINTVLTGGVLTERLESLVRADAERQRIDYDEALRLAQASIPVGRFATPQEFAPPVVFLLSGPASYWTGTSVSLDGGLSKSV